MGPLNPYSPKKKKVLARLHQPERCPVPDTEVKQN